MTAARPAQDGVPGSSDAVVLLHGLGASAGVWAPVRRVLAERAPELTVLAPDLPGHGSAPALEHYSFGTMTAEVADVVAREDLERITVVGHSLGGVLALVLASGWFRLPITGALTLGIRTVWSEDDHARAAAVAQRPVRWFDTEAEAVDRFARLAGLRPEQLADVDLGGAVREHDGRFRVAQDPANFSIGAPDMRSLLAAAAVPVVLAAGEHDGGVDLDELRAAGGRVFPGVGHNAHVEAPDEVAKAVLEAAARTPGRSR